VLHLGDEKKKKAGAARDNTKPDAGAGQADRKDGKGKFCKLCMTTTDHFMEHCKRFPAFDSWRRGDTQQSTHLTTLEEKQQPRSHFACLANVKPAAQSVSEPIPAARAAAASRIPPVGMMTKCIIMMLVLFICLFVPTRAKVEHESVGDAAEAPTEHAMVCMLTHNITALLDSGATNTMSPRTDGMANLRPCVVGVGTAGEEPLFSSHIGNLTVDVMDVDGVRVPVTFHDVHVVPKIKRFLVSVNKLRRLGHPVRFEQDRTYIQLGDHEIPVVELGGLSELILYPPREQAHAAPDLSGLFHRRCGHTSYLPELGALDVGVPKGLKLKHKCGVCQLVKNKRVSFTKPVSRNLKLKPFEEMHMDLGDVSIVSVGGMRWYMICTCRTTRWRFIYFLPRKSDVVAALDELLGDIHSRRGDLKYIHTDTGSEFVGAPTEKWARDYGVQILPGGPYAPEQNGIAERSNQTVFQCASACRRYAGLDTDMWVPSMCHAVYLCNRIPTSALGGTTPFYALNGYHCDLSHIRIYGCRAFVHESVRAKNDVKAKEGIYVGADEYNPRRCRILVPVNGKWKIVLNPHVEVDETVFPARSPSFGASNYTLALDEEVLGGDGSSPAVGDGPPATGEMEQPVELPEPVGAGAEPGAQEPDADPEQDADHDDGSRPRRAGASNQRCNIPDCPEARQHGAVHAAHTARVTVEHAYSAYTNISSASEQEPQSYKEAMLSPNRDKWSKAIDDEMASQRSNKSWVLVPRTPDMHVIKNRWVFKLKRDHTGRVVRFKARLVVLGFAQAFGIDYFETFAPVAKFGSIRLLLALAAILNLELHQLDVDTAFLQAPVNETIYMFQPEGSEVRGPNGEEMVCLLKKSVYGLKQAPRNWNKDIDQYLRSLGFKPSAVDACIYIKWVNSKDCIILGLYVDDLVVAASNMKLVNEFKRAISGHYKMKDLGELRFVLGVEVIRDRPNRMLRLCQSAYVDQVLERFGASGCYHGHIPAAGYLPKLEGGKPDGRFMSLVGALMYLSLMTRPDITYAVQALARHLQASGPEHWEAVMRVLRYLQKTKTLGITYRGDKESQVPKLYGMIGIPSLKGYMDADWAADLNNRRSTTGYVFLMGGAAISWASKLQTTVSLSTAEAEYKAAAAATQEALYQRQLLADLGFKQEGPTVLYEDNTAAESLIKNPVLHQRSKHIDIKYHFIRERYQSGEIDVQHVSSKDQLADVLTKPLMRQPFELLRPRVMGT
jgi:transposase InsO family protein